MILCIRRRTKSVLLKIKFEISRTEIGKKGKVETEAQGSRP